jgi:3-oxoacyl-[acyl-carrier protein] reductase
MINKYKLKGEVAVVTGGASGIGKGIVKNLLISGAQVAVIGRTEKSLNSLQNEFKKLGEIICISADVKNYLEVKDAFKKIGEKWSKINILINNAGITDDKLAIRMSEDSWNEVIDINLNGTFNCIKNALPSMIKNKGGKIINMSSVVGIMGNSGQSNYCASKAGIIGLTKSLAKEYGKKLININAIAPGFIKTNMTDKINVDRFLDSIALDRLGAVDDVANLVCFLCSKDASYITGQVINVDGGLLT